MLVGSQSFTRAFFGVAIFIKAALQIQLMRVEIFRPAFFRRLHLLLNFLFRRRTRIRSAESTAQLFDDRLREFGLHREHVLQITGIIFRPEFLAGISAGEPSSDPHRVAGFAHTPLDQMRHAELLTNFLDCGVLAFE